MNQDNKQNEISKQQNDGKRRRKTLLSDGILQTGFLQVRRKTETRRHVTARNSPSDPAPTGEGNHQEPYNALGAQTPCKDG